MADRAPHVHGQTEDMRNRTTIVGFAAGAFVVAAVTSGSTILTLVAALLAILVSVISPLAGMVALAFAAPLARTLVIPPPGLYVAMAAGMVLGMLLRLPVSRGRPRMPTAEVLLLSAFLLYAAAQLIAGRLDGPAHSNATEVASLFARVTECVVAFGIAWLVLRDKAPHPVLAALLLSAAINGCSASRSWWESTVPSPS